MKIGILTRNPDAWCSAQLRAAVKRKGHEPISFFFTELSAKVRGKPKVVVAGHDVGKELSALIVRPIGRGSLDEVIFRLDVLHRLERSGLPITNPPASIEKAVDKYRALFLLEEEGIPTPRTVATESPRRALEAFEELGGDVVIKPIFGSRGMGVTRVSDVEVARRIFHNLNYNRNVLYIQEFIPHGTKDVRAFVVDGRVIAAMERVADSWKTNVSQGARPVPIEPSRELEEMAVKAAETIGCKVAGVDIIEGPNGLLVNELNSQPGFRGLQSVTKVNIAEKIVEYVIERARR